MRELNNQCNFPWLLTNIRHPNGDSIGDAIETHIIEHEGLRIGVVGLVEDLWLATLGSFDPEDIVYEDFVTSGERAAKKLKTEDKCDFVVALTHMRIFNDNILANNTESIDLILGGHDHCLYLNQTNDNLVVKSGTDFKNISHITIEICDQKPTLPDAGIEREGLEYELNTPFQYFIKNKYLVTCTRQDVTRKIKRNDDLYKHVQFYAADLKKKFDEPMFWHDFDMNTQASFIRNYECDFGNFICDLVKYEICSDLVFLTAGSIRSDVVYPAGARTLGDIYDMFPFTTQICKLEGTGDLILALLNNSVSKWPIQEGRFAQTAGVTFKFNPDLPMGERVLPESVFINNELLVNDKTYTFACTSFMASGHDGFDACKDAKIIIDEENGPEIKTIMQEFFSLGKDCCYRKELQVYRTDFQHSMEKKFDKDIEQVVKKRLAIVANSDKSSSKLGSLLTGVEFKSLCTAISAPVYVKNLEKISNLNDVEHASHLHDETKVLDFSCLKRIKKYKTLKGVHEVDGAKLFSISQVPGNRCLVDKPESPKPEKEEEFDYDVIGGNDSDDDVEDQKQPLEKPKKEVAKKEGKIVEKNDSVVTLSKADYEIMKEEIKQSVIAEITPQLRAEILEEVRKLIKK